MRRRFFSAPSPPPRRPAGRGALSVTAPAPPQKSWRGRNPPKQEEPPKAWAAPKLAAQKASAATKREREQFSSYSHLPRLLAVPLSKRRAGTMGLSGTRGRHRAAPCRRCPTASASEGSRHDRRGGMQHAVLPSAARAALVLQVLFEQRADGSGGWRMAGASIRHDGQVLAPVQTEKPA